MESINSAQISPFVITAHEMALLPPPMFIQLPSPAHVLRTVNPKICMNSFSCPADKFVTKILNLLSPHVELGPTTDPFVILNHIFDTYRTRQIILQHQAMISKL